MSEIVDITTAGVFEQSSQDQYQACVQACGNCVMQRLGLGGVAEFRQDASETISFGQSQEAGLQLEPSASGVAYPSTEGVERLQHSFKERAFDKLTEANEAAKALAAAGETCPGRSTTDKLLGRCAVEPAVQRDALAHVLPADHRYMRKLDKKIQADHDNS